MTAVLSLYVWQKFVTQQRLIHYSSAFSYSVIKSVISTIRFFCQASSLSLFVLLHVPLAFLISLRIYVYFCLVLSHPLILLPLDENELGRMQLGSEHS